MKLADQNQVLKESIISISPMRIRRNIWWGDCDPAGVVYAPRILDYAISATDLFVKCHFEYESSSNKHPYSIGTPAKSFEMDFHKSLYPNDIIDIAVNVESIKLETFTLEVKGFKASNKLAFEVKITLICVDNDVRKRTSIPKEWRDVLLDHLPDTMQ